MKEKDAKKMIDKICEEQERQIAKEYDERILNPRGSKNQQGTSRKELLREQSPNTSYNSQSSPSRRSSQPQSSTFSDYDQYRESRAFVDQVEEDGRTKLVIDKKELEMEMQLEKAKRTKRAVITILCIVLVIALSFAVWFFFIHDKDDTKTKKKTTTKTEKQTEQEIEINPEDIEIEEPETPTTDKTTTQTETDTTTNTEQTTE